MVLPSAGVARMWSRVATLQPVTGTGLPQPTSQLDRCIGAPPTNLKTLPASSLAVAPSIGNGRMCSKGGHAPRGDRHRVTATHAATGQVDRGAADELEDVAGLVPRRRTVRRPRPHVVQPGHRSAGEAHGSTATHRTAGDADRCATDVLEH